MNYIWFRKLFEKILNTNKHKQRKEKIMNYMVKIYTQSIIDNKNTK